MTNRRKVILALFATIAALSFPRSAPAAQMIGYWAAYARMPLGQTSSNYDVIELAFGTPNTDGATITFTHNVGTESDAQLTADVATMHAAGKKVLLSIGGATATSLNLATAANITSFETSVESIIDKFGLDGIDLDLENGAMNLNAGDNDIFNPTTPKCVNLITACHDLRNHYGGGFMLTMLTGSTGRCRPSGGATFCHSSTAPETC
jgi:chitinase